MLSTAVRRMIGRIGLRLLKNMRNGTRDTRIETAVSANISASERKFLHKKMMTMKNTVKISFMRASSRWTGEAPA